jgi:hypothetical protein
VYSAADSHAAIEDAKFKGVAAPAAASAAAAAAAAGAGASMTDDDDLAAAIALSMTGGATAGAGDSSASGSAGAGAGAASAIPADADGFTAVGPGLPAKFRGAYELFAVVSHKGRSADSGHYMGWVRRDGGAWHVVVLALRSLLARIC